MCFMINKLGAPVVNMSSSLRAAPRLSTCVYTMDKVNGAKPKILEDVSLAGIAKHIHKLASSDNSTERYFACTDQHLT